MFDNAQSMSVSDFKYFGGVFFMQIKDVYLVYKLLGH